LALLLLCIGSLNAQDLNALNKRVSKLRLYRDTLVWKTVDSLIHLTDEAGQLQLNTDARITKGALYYTFTQPAKGVAYLEELRNEVYDEASLENKFRLLNNLAQGYLYLEAYDSALDNALQAYYLSKEHSDASWVKSSAMKVGQCNLLLGPKEQSVPYLVESLEIAYAQADKIKIIQVSNNLLDPHNDKLDQEPFKLYFKKYLNYLEDQEIPLDSRHAGIMSIVDSTISTSHLRKLYANITEFDLSNTRMTLVEIIYRALTERQLPEQAIDILRAELNTGIYDESLTDRKNLYSYLARSYADAGDWEEAYKHLQAYSRAEQSLRNESIQQRIDSLNVLYQSVQREKLIAEQALALRKKKELNLIIIGSALTLLIVMVLIIYMIRRKLAYEKSLRQQEKKIQEEKGLRLERENKILAMDYVLLGEEQERKRIAKDLHDSLGSLLSSAQLQLDKIQSEIDNLKQMDLFAHAESLIKNASQEVRRISHDMMPEALVNLGLQASIEDLALEINRSEKLKVSTFFSSFDESRISDKQKLGLFRIVQELSQNTVKHAQASQLIIQGSMDNELLSLVVEDDGAGFDVEAKTRNHSGLGLQNIFSRVKHLDGRIDIESVRGKKTVFSIELPI